jgi:hypothetical protein
MPQPHASELGMFYSRARGSRCQTIVTMGLIGFGPADLVEAIRRRARAVPACVSFGDAGALQF